jgi:predicted ester cyclase
MMTQEDQHEAIVRAYLEDVYNGHDLQSLEKYLSTDWVAHWLGDRVLRGMAAWKEAMASFFEAFPDATYTLSDLFFVGDKGVWRGIWRATQHNDWEGIVASGRTAMWSAIIIGRFAGGKLVENWAEYDRFSMVRQLGASLDNKSFESFEQVRSMH